MQNELIEKLNAEISRLRDSASTFSNLHLEAEQSSSEWREAYFALLAKTKEGAEQN